MVIRRRPHPRPIMHVYGDRPCGGIACLMTVDIDFDDPFDVAYFQHLWGHDILDHEVPTCDECGEVLPFDNITHSIDHPPQVDHLKVAMKIVLAKHKRGLLPSIEGVSP